MDWSFLAISAAFCPLVNAMTIGDAGYILLPGYRANSGASINGKNQPCKSDREMAATQRRGTFPSLNPLQAAT